jgi:predicted RNA-binding protein YlxR (DUF448 family)
MGENVGRISISQDNKIKLEYEDGAGRKVALWEPFSGGVMETIHNEHGAVLKQSMFKNKKNNILNERIGVILQSASITRTAECEYSEIRLAKQCPACGGAVLKRVSDFTQEMPNVPVMPTYECSGCKGRGYYLTDEYLEQLLTEQAKLFSRQEKKEMEENRAAFKAQLNEYIIRIFASKRILQIK